LNDKNQKKQIDKDRKGKKDNSEKTDLNALNPASRQLRLKED
jgi:hypothetical protein